MTRGQIALASANSTPNAHAEALAVLTDLADGRTGHVPAALLAAEAIRVTEGADFPVQRAALDALLRRLDSARAGDGYRVVAGPRGGGPLGAFRLSAPGRDAAPWRAVLRSLDPPGGSCACPDYAKGSLGLCKHLLWLLDCAFRPARGRPAASPVVRRALPQLPALSWDPVRPLDGAGDWLERVRFVPPPPAAGRALSFSRAAVGRHFGSAVGGLARPLARTFPNDPKRRLALVRDLASFARTFRQGSSSVDPALAGLLGREEAALAGRVDCAWTDRERARHLGTLKRPLFPYQEEGVRRFLDAERLLLADDMGLGKTAQAIAGCHALFASRRVCKGLVVVPAALKPQWLREWRQFSNVPVALVEGPPEERARQLRATREGFLVVNYEQVLKDLPQLLRFAPEVVVLDEAQRIKNWATKTAQYVKRLAPRYRLVLTGTPLENRLDELASLMEWVDELALEPKWRLSPYHATLADGGREVVGARNLDTLRKRLLPSTVRRVRKEVLSQLPPRRDTRVPVPLTAEQREAHEELDRPIASLMQRAQTRPLTQPEFLRLMSLLTRQRILCNALAQRDFEQVWPTLERAGRPSEELLRGLCSPKLGELRELLAHLVVTQQRKVVIFSQWRRMLRLAEWATKDVWGDAGLRAVYFSGDEGQRRRTQNLVDFHDDPKTRILFATDAGGVGLNLQKAASACVHLDLPWNPAVLEQRTGRIYRLGQLDPVEVYYLTSAEGIESRIAALVGDKKALFDGVFDGDRDEVRFERGGSFLSTVKRLLEPQVVPDEAAPPEDDPAPAALLPDLSDTTPSSPEPSVAPPDPAHAPGGGSGHGPPSSTEDPVGALFSRLRVERQPDGGLVVQAPPEAARALSSLLQGVAALLAGPAAG